MQINNISKYQNEVYGTSKHYESDVEFKDILSQMLQSDSKSSSVDSVDTFRDNINKYGIMNTVNIMNNEEIEKQLEIKRAELLKALDVSNMNPSDKAAALASIEETLDRYKKDLQKLNSAYDSEKLENSSLKKLFAVIWFGVKPLQIYS